MAPSPRTFFTIGVALLGLAGLSWVEDTPAQLALYTAGPGTVISTVRPVSMSMAPNAHQYPSRPSMAYGAPQYHSAASASALAPLAAAAGEAGSKGTIVVIGASGQSGSEAVFQALARGYKVTGLVRDPSKLTIPAGSGAEKAGQPFPSDNLELVGGSVTEMADVKRALMADDIAGVVVALGGKTKDVGTTMLTDGTKNVIEAMKAKGLKRISVITSIGAGDSEKQAPFFFRILMGTVMRGIFEDKNNQENLFLAGPGSDLEYTIVRPGGLTVEPPNGVINVIDGEAGSISRADVAAFCLDAITDPDWQYIGKTPCISSVGGTSWTKDRSPAARGE